MENFTETFTEQVTEAFDHLFNGTDLIDDPIAEAQLGEQVASAIPSPTMCGFSLPIGYILIALVNWLTFSLLAACIACYNSGNWWSMDVFFSVVKCVAFLVVAVIFYKIMNCACGFFALCSGHKLKKRRRRDDRIEEGDLD